MANGNIVLSELTADRFAARTGDLTNLLVACVHAGANINFVLPFPDSAARAFWRDRVMPAMAKGDLLVFVAEAEGRLAGSVQLVIGMPPNQPHRAEIAKLMVHPELRRRGIAKALMAMAENRARGLGRRLITLDTRTGDKAEPLYTALGYITVGIIPDFCRDPFEDRFHPTTIMYKAL